MIYNASAECMDRKALERLQMERLQQTVKHVYENVPLYKERFDAKGITPGDIKTLEDLELLPFTVKDDLRQTYPFGMFAVPMRQVARIHASSGTTGHPIVVGYTSEDINTWAEAIARTLSAGGTTAGDIVHNAYGYGLFTGGLGIHYGAERLGAAVVPISGGQTKRQVQLLQDFGSNVICCTPSYALYIGEMAAEAELDLEKLPLRAGFFGAEPWTEAMRKTIEDCLGIEALDIYGLSEVMGPGVSYNCLLKCGLHINEDFFIPEIIDPITGKPLPPGETGELVFTTITKEAFPVIRYRTRDITSLSYEKCSCGRTFARMQRVSGRTDDMLIIRGVNIFPSQIESVLMEIEETEPHYQLIVDRQEKSLDTLEVWVEVSANIFSDEMRKLEALQKKVRHEIEALLGISVSVKLVEPRTIARSEGKAKRIIDKREI
ncbi:MAG: phenylacetate--CoA ligase [bacterium]|jgi:phenylacetate-CoA ligase|nr:phenylacetate--CoA ligase [bacterium]MDD4557484.1 phenylacetate--CoA ligase [bacterium]